MDYRALNKTTSWVVSGMKLEPVTSLEFSSAITGASDYKKTMYSNFIPKEFEEFGIKMVMRRELALKRNNELAIEFSHKLPLHYQTLTF
ncbi:hypothetical protein CR513_21425, partial [Mucuna pruriens]